LAGLFPLLEGQEFDDLVKDIGERGLREKIVTFEGKILDGRNRFRACKSAHVEPLFREYRGKDPLGEVISLNLRRRHLDESQRAMVAARVANLGEGRPKKTGSIDPVSQGDASGLLNVSTPSVKRARVVLEKGAPELIAAVDQGKLAVSAASVIAANASQAAQRKAAENPIKAKEIAKQLKQKKQDENRERRVEALATKESAKPMPDRLYNVVYADPPWRYDGGFTTDNRKVENNYPTMTLDEIKALRPPAANDAVLFLWATSPLLPGALEVLKAWGFTYKTSAVWQKPGTGMGYYFRQNHELILVGVRGDIPTPPPKARPGSVFTCASARSEHSAKPTEVRAAIEAMYPRLPRVELFARDVPDGWDTWGLEA
jgi:N6-adenosine-specific RNA methylase IME4